MKRILDNLHASSLNRRTLLTGAAALGAASLTTSVPRAFGQTKQVRFLNSEPSRESVAVLQKAAADYESQTGVSVTIDTVPPGEAWAKLQASIASGQPYDIATLAFAAHVALLAGDDMLVPLNDLVQKHEWGPRILFPINDQYYWYPYDYNLCWMYYRKDLYAEKGLSVPQNQAQMLENCTALTSDNRFGVMHPLGSNSAAQWMSLGYMWANDVNIIDDSWNLVLDNDVMKPRAIAYLDFMKSLSGTMPPGLTQAEFATALAQFSSDQVAHAPYAGRMIEYLEQKAPDMVENVGYFTFPSENGEKRAINHGYDGWVVLKTGMSEEAVKFLDWLTTDRYVDFLHTAPLHFQPARLDIYEDAKWRSNPLIQKHAEFIEFQKNLLDDEDLIIRSVDTQGPAPDVRQGKLFEAYGLPEAWQLRLLQDVPAAEALERGAELYRKALA